MRIYVPLLSVPEIYVIEYVLGERSGTREHTCLVERNGTRPVVGESPAAECEWLLGQRKYVGSTGPR